MFYPVRFDVVDNSNVGVDNASVSPRSVKKRNGTQTQTASGWVTMFLPSTTELGSLNATVSWKGVMLQPSAIPVGNSTTIRFILPLTKMILNLHMSRLPLPGAEVTLSSSGNEIGRGLTGPDGSISFGRLPEGNYSINVSYLLTQYNVRSASALVRESRWTFRSHRIRE